MATNVILREGFAYAEVIDMIITDKEGKPRKSRAGDIMAELKLHVTDKAGRFTTLYDYILPTHPKLLWKMASIKKCFCVGDFFVNGIWLPHVLMYKSGPVTIKTQEASGEYGEKTVIGSYMDKDVVNMLTNMPDNVSDQPAPLATSVATKTSNPSAYAAKEEDLDDDVPF